MKNGATIPRKPSKHGKASVERSERKRHKAFLTIKPIGWEKTDKQIKMKQPAVKQGKSAGFEKSLVCITRKRTTREIHPMEKGFTRQSRDGKERLGVNHVIIDRPQR